MVRYFMIFLIASAAAAHELPRPGRAFAFPADHGAHGTFKTEWWYVTGHLTAPGKKLTGFQVTFFRASTGASAVATAPTRFAIPDLYLAHFALVDANGFAHAERLARPGPGWSRAGDLDVGCDGWTLKRDGNRWKMRASDAIGSLELDLEPLREPVLHGEKGFHRKGPCPSCASHYVSIPRLRATGTLGGAKVEGEAWFDHEFMSGGLDRGQKGWDWMGLRLDDGSELMIARMRGDAGDRTDGTLSGQPLPLGSIELTALDHWTSPSSGARYPVRLRAVIASKGVSLELEPVRLDQELSTPGSTGVTYWEGLVRVRGTRDGRPVTGLGYLELTGYAGRTPLAPGGPGGSGGGR
jgi:predicted secreted hydrolase